MWKHIREKYFLSFAFNSQQYEIFITDYISIWTAKYCEKDFIDQLKKNNEGLLLENDEDYIENGLYVLNADYDKLKNARIEESGENLLLFMKVVTEYPFRLECKLLKCSNEYFFRKVTQPLLKTISELKSSQDDLIQLLVKKDKEVKAYKRELDNRKIIFPHEETKQFNEIEHRKMCPTYTENFGSSNIPKNLLNESSKSAQKTITQNSPSIVSIKQEPDSTREESHNIKQEPGNIKQESHTITQEPVSMKQEPQASQTIKHEPVSMKQDPDSMKTESGSINEGINIKLEPNTPVSEDQTEPLVTQSSPICMVIKPESFQRRNNDRRKKLKLSY